MPLPLGVAILVGFFRLFLPFFLGEIWAGFYQNMRLVLLFIPGFIALVEPLMQTGPSPPYPSFAGGPFLPPGTSSSPRPVQTPNLQPGGVCRELMVLLKHFWL